MIQTIAYAACYVYSPAGRGALCERSRLLRALLKSGDANFMLKYAVRVRQQAHDSPQLEGFFGATDILVPVPGCTPDPVGRSWTAEHLAIALVNAGLGAEAWSGLHRVRAVVKSATAAPGCRPSVGVHYESFILQQSHRSPERIVLIDDVISKGRTLLAAASRVHEAFPAAQVRAFALVRTMGFITGVQRLLDPCKGEIRWRDGDAYRIP